ncbi:MAG: hypothetical protein FJ284_03405 [Planctomycetes bacterium]|nr:hypothetical protein [Planctomycetota bacterium]
MAGSFNIFRRYQKAALAALAIMAMLAFFALPPILQMGGDGGGDAGDDLVLSWQGGHLRERDLQRAVIVQRALNQFLMALQAAASGSDRVQPPLRDDEKSVVDALLMAREAKANGFVVSDAVVNDFLSVWTGDRVKPDQIAGVIDQLRARAGITEQDIFDGLRTLLLGNRMQLLTLRGTDFAGSPPGWRWDAFRRLEQSATVEVVPVVVESLAGDVVEPTAAQMQDLYDLYAQDLPRARSATPGFREPARIRYDAVLSTPDLFVAESEKEVTDEAIAKFYDENKDTLFKKVEPSKDTDAAPAAGGRSQPSAADPQAREAGPPADQPADTKPAEPPPAGDAPAQNAPAATEPPPTDAAPATPAASDSGAVAAGVLHPVAFRQPIEPAAAEAPPAPPEPKAEPVAEADVAAKQPADAAANQPADAAVKPAADAAPAAAHEPLEEVRDDIRKRLGRAAADRKVGELFDKVAGRIATFADDLELAVGLSKALPAAPNVTTLAAEHGLESLQSGFVDAGEAVSAGGIGTSFLLSFSEQFGVRQQQWADMVFAPDAPRWRPLRTRDIAGNQYLSWKTEDRPEYSPPLDDVRDEVRRVWRLLEARPLAEKRAKEIMAGAAGKTLADAVAGQTGLQAMTAGPFTWLTRGTAPFGSAPVVSQPDGLQMPGEDFMRVVFGLEVGGAAVAFNEPRTICYAIRLASFEPAEEALQERFVDASADPRRMALLAEDETRGVRDRWITDIQRRYAVEWKREPR